MRLLLVLFTIIPILSFRISFKMHNKLVFNAESNDHNDNKMPKIINLHDLANLVDDMDEEVLKRLNHFILTVPQTEEEIEKNSFEGYLQTHFKVIKNNENKIDFERFLSWRKEIGTFLTNDELFSIYNEINENNEYCDIMNFILINKVIDEIDGTNF